MAKYCSLAKKILCSRATAASSNAAVINHHSAANTRIPSRRAPGKPRRCQIAQNIRKHIRAISPVERVNEVICHIAFPKII